MLNAKQIIDEGLLKLSESKGKPAQVGYDLSIKSINTIGTSTSNGVVLKDATVLNVYTALPKTNVGDKTGWYLYKGTYDLTFWEGCKIAANRVGFIIQRSSLLRNGALIVSSIFDPGFETENMGTILRVNETIFIEEDARVAQIYFHECEPGEIYAGQWQGDKQRT